MKNHTPSTELACFSFGTGVADEGVSLLLHIGSYRVLLDCGIRNIDLLKEDLSSVDLAWCSHAHPDHARGLIQIHKLYPQIPIFASETTGRLLPLIESNHGSNGSNGSTARQGFDWVQALPWRSLIELMPGLTAFLLPAGHLPGAAILQLSYARDLNPISPIPHSQFQVIYTGDMALSGMRFVEGLPLAELRSLRPDVLIVEGSYGTSRFPRRRQLENQWVEQVLQGIQSGKSVLLPVSAIGMGTELLILLRSHHRFTGQAIDIWVDDVIARSCDTYLELLSQFPSNVQNFARYQSLFWDDHIRPFVKRLPIQDASAEYDLTHPCVLLVSDESYWWHYCQSKEPPWLILLLDKPGRSLSEVWSQNLKHLTQGAIAVNLETYFLTEHCDLAGTLQVIHTLRPQHVVLIHGSPDYLTDLSSLDELSNRYQLHTPSVGHWVELPIGATFYQPPPPENRYEGEVTLLPTAVQITLPTELTLNPRWISFADTGLVDVRWQGDELILKGVSSQDLISRDREANWVRPEYDPRPVCGTCRYYHAQHCRNLDSPMAGLKVTQDGYCPMYEATLKD